MYPAKNSSPVVAPFVIHTAVPKSIAALTHPIVRCIASVYEYFVASSNVTKKGGLLLLAVLIPVVPDVIVVGVKLLLAVAVVGSAAAVLVLPDMEAMVVVVLLLLLSLPGIIVTDTGSGGDSSSLELGLSPSKGLFFNVIGKAVVVVDGSDLLEFSLLILLLIPNCGFRLSWTVLLLKYEWWC